MAMPHVVTTSSIAVTPLVALLPWRALLMAAASLQHRHPCQGKLPATPDTPGWPPCPAHLRSVTRGSNSARRTSGSIQAVANAHAHGSGGAGRLVPLPPAAGSPLAAARTPAHPQRQHPLTTPRSCWLTARAGSSGCARERSACKSGCTSAVRNKHGLMYHASLCITTSLCRPDDMAAACKYTKMVHCIDMHAPGRGLCSLQRGERCRGCLLRSVGGGCFCWGVASPRRC
jgi:hypothetical protein